MIRNLSYRKKNRLLLIISLLFLLIIYYIAISKTIHLSTETSELQQKADLISNISIKIQELKQVLNEDIGMSSDENSPGKMLALIGKLCKKWRLELKHYPKPITNDQNEYLVRTIVVKVGGKYVDIVRFIYDMENEKDVGRISSVTFNIEKIRKAKEEKLVASIYLQRIEQKIQFLLPVLLMIWGLIIYNLLVTLNPEESTNLEKKRINLSNHFTNTKHALDTIKIIANYRDPFLSGNEKVIKTKKKTIIAKVQKKEIRWPVIKYAGLIRNNKVDKTLAIVSINGREIFMTIGDVAQEVRLAKVQKDSIKVVYKSQQRIIRRANS